MGKASEIEQFVIDKVREIRLLKNFGQKQLSIHMGLNGKFVGNVESTKTPDKYNLNHLNKIAEILDCSMRDFFPEKPIPGEIERVYPK